MTPKNLKTLTALLLLFVSSSMCFKHNQRINFKKMHASKLVYITKSHFYKGGHIHFSARIDKPKTSSTASLSYNILLFK